VEGYENTLKLYHNLCIEEWVSRGYRNTMKLEHVDYNIEYPSWFGNDGFHASHRSNLLRKNFCFYSAYQWHENPNDPYVWVNVDDRLYTKVNKTVTILK
jgi:hypothetical protein